MKILKTTIVYDQSGSKAEYFIDCEEEALRPVTKGDVAYASLDERTYAFQHGGSLFRAAVLVAKNLIDWETGLRLDPETGKWS